MNKIIVLASESSGGKDTTAKALIDKFGWHFAISYTTRPKRDSEVDGVEYFFIDNDEFDKKFEDGELFEKTLYTPNGKRWQYGLGKNSFADNNTSVVIVNPHGLEQLMKSDIADRLIVFKLKCPMEDRIKRYLNRDTVTNDIKIELVDRILKDIEDFEGFIDKFNVFEIDSGDGIMIDFICRQISFLCTTEFKKED